MAGARSRFKASILAAAVLLTACASESGPRRADMTAAFAQLNAILREANTQPTPLAKYDLYRRHLDDTPALHEAIVQPMAALAAAMGAYGTAAALYPNPQRLPEPFDPLLDPSRYQAVDAASEIAALARDRRIVMVNEAHHVAQTRLLTLRLLPKLRELGFTHFAAETLDEKDTQLASRGYPLETSGHYVGEPLYGEIVRTALKLGYVVVPYESTNDHASPAQREDDQARHLVDRVFARTPNAKLFVHAGYAHIDKRDDEFFTEPLAVRLAQRTRFAPLTVDQTKLRFIVGHPNAGYDALIETFHIAGPTVLVSRDTRSPWSLIAPLFDVSVILPPPHDRDGRPNWLTLEGMRRAVILERLSTPDAYVLEARYATESDDAVPADRQLIDDGNASSTLYLKPGEYRIRAIDAANTVLMRQSLRVD
jgi:hypothetical protein